MARHQKSKGLEPDSKALAQRQLGQLEASISKVRDLINAARRHDSLLQQANDFRLVCSAMDMIDDTIMALTSYIDHDQQDQGQAYLEIFGVLQAMAVQQDAVRKLHRVVTGTCPDLEATYPDVKEIRDIRVRVVGHPVGGKKDSSHFLTRYTVSKKGFEFWAYDQSGGRTVAEVDLIDLVARNSASLHAALSETVASMEDEDKAHKTAFAGEKLAAIFHNSVYCSGKLFEGVSRRDPIGEVGSRCLRAMVTDFKEALDQRSSHFLRGGLLSYELPTLEHALDRYEEFLSSDKDRNEHDGYYILARYIQVAISELAQFARVDEEYSLKRPLDGMKSEERI